MSPRRIFVRLSALSLVAIASVGAFWSVALWALLPVLPVVLLGAYDILQTKHAIRRNFPFLGRFRYWFEAVRPEIHQYFIESNSSGRPFICSGKIVTGFDLAHKIAIGADLCNSARAMMFALGCIQAQKCNTNECPTGVATQDPGLVAGLVVADKAVRVRNFQHNTVKAFVELLAASGLRAPSELRPWHILRRVSPTEVRHYGEMYEYLQDRALLTEPVPKSFARAWRAASAVTFEAAVKD